MVRNLSQDWGRTDFPEKPSRLTLLWRQIDSNRFQLDPSRWTVPLKSKCIPFCVLCTSKYLHAQWHHRNWLEKLRTHIQAWCFTACFPLFQFSKFSYVLSTSIFLLTTCFLYSYCLMLTRSFILVFMLIRCIKSQIPCDHLFPHSHFPDAYPLMFPHFPIACLFLIFPLTVLDLFFPRFSIITNAMFPSVAFYLTCILLSWLFPYTI